MNRGQSLRVSGSEVFLRGAHFCYKFVISPVLHTGAGMAGGACRFQPTCSEYAVIALHEHGLLRGGWMFLKRILRCRPGVAGGFDPVPFKQSSPAPVTMQKAPFSHESRS